MDSLVATEMQSVFGPRLGECSWPDGVFANLEIDVCCEDKDRGHGFPVVFWGPALNATRLMYSAMAQHLEGMDYEVITMDHPYEMSVVEFPDGTVIYGGRIEYEWHEDDPDESLRHGSRGAVRRRVLHPPLHRHQQR